MKWTLDEFMAGKLDVRCANKSEVKAFMKILGKMNVLWHSGSKADEFIPPIDDDGVYIRYNNYRDNRLTFGRSKDKNERTEPWSDFVGYPNRIPAKYKVEIECDGTTTTAKLIVDGKEVKSTTAKKHPEDKFNLKLGMETAFSRLWDKKEADPTPAATTTTEPMKNKLRFKVGDRIIYVKPEVGAYNEIKGWHGRIVKTKESAYCGVYDYGVEFDNDLFGTKCFYHDCDGYAKKNHGLYVCEDEIIPEPPEKETRPWCKFSATGNPLRFRVGDRVVMKRPASLYKSIEGFCGTITRVEDTPPYDYRVLFDDCIIGHGFNVDYVSYIPKDKPGHCLWVDDEWLEPEPKTT